MEEKGGDCFDFCLLSGGALLIKFLYACVCLYKLAPLTTTRGHPIDGPHRILLTLLLSLAPCHVRRCPLCVCAKILWNKFIRCIKKRQEKKKKKHRDRHRRGTTLGAAMAAAFEVDVDMDVEMDWGM